MTTETISKIWQSIEEQKKRVDAYLKLSEKEKLIEHLKSCFISTQGTGNCCINARHYEMSFDELLSFLENEGFVCEAFKKHYIDVGLPKK